MPIIEITLFRGRSAETKQTMMRAVTNAVVDTLGAAPGDVRVILREIEHDGLTIGGEYKRNRSATGGGV